NTLRLACHNATAVAGNARARPSTAALSPANVHAAIGVVPKRHPVWALIASARIPIRSAMTVRIVAPRVGNVRSQVRALGAIASTAAEPTVAPVAARTVAGGSLLGRATPVARVARTGSSPAVSPRFC